MKWEVRTMRSGTSFFNWTICKKTALRFWPVWAAYFVIWLIILPLNGLMLISVQASSTIRDIGYMEGFACRTVPGTVGLSLTLAVAFGLLSAMAAFSHLYNSRPANFFGALPVRREGLFLTHYLTGLAFLVVPNLAIALLVLVIEAIGGWVSIQGLLFWLAVTCGEGFLFYSMAVFCAMFTGHLLALPVFYGVLNVLAAGLCTLFTAICRAFYYGYSGSGGLIYRAAQAFTPVWRLNASVYSTYRSAEGSGVPSMAPVGEVITEPSFTFQGLNLVGMYAGAAAVLVLASFFLYRARRLESAGDVVSVKPMKPVFKYGVALCSGLAFGMATTVFLNTGEIGLMVGIVVWGVAGYFVAQMLLDKSFRVFKKWKGAVAVAGVFVALFCVVGFDLTGYETRVPNPDDVDSVYFSGMDPAGLGDSGDYVSTITTDQGQIKLLMDLHQAAIGQRGMWRPNGGYDTNGLRYSANLSLEYYLKDGSTLSRSYTIWLDPEEVDQEGSAAWLVQQLYNDRDLYWVVYGFDNMDHFLDEEGWWMEQARYDYYRYNDEGPGVQQYYYGKNAQALYEAVKEDFLAGRIGVRRVDGGWDRNYEREIYFSAVGSEGQGTSLRIFVQDTASSTLAALETLEQG